MTVGAFWFKKKARLLFFVNKKSEAPDSERCPGFCVVDHKGRVSVPVDEGRLFLQKNNLEQNLPNQLTIIPDEHGSALLAMTQQQHEALMLKLINQDRKRLNLICLLTEHFKFEIGHKNKKQKCVSQKTADNQSGELPNFFRLSPLSSLYKLGLIELGEKLKIICVQHENGSCLQIYPAHFEVREFKYFSDLRKRIEDVCRFYKFD